VTKARAAVLAALQLALHLLLLTGTLALLPDGARLALAFVAIVLLPGHGWLAAIGARPPGGTWLAPGWALGLGVAWQAALVLATHVLHQPFTVLAGAGAAFSLLPWAVVAVRRPAEAEPEPAPALGGAALVAVLLAAVLAAWHCARLGTPVTYYSDSPDHIGTIRRMLASGSAFPADAFFRDAGPMGADPRKGLWHPIVALLCRVSNVDPWPAWRMLGSVIAPLFVLNSASFAWLLGGPLAAAVGAWGLLLTYGGSLSTVFLREAGLATKLADQLALAVATAVLADLASRTARARATAIGLALGAVAAHVFAAIQFATVFGALGLGLLVRDRRTGPEFRRLAGTSLALGAACLPYLLWRAIGAYAPTNPVHTEPQGLFYLADGVFTVNPGTFWEWLGFGAYLFPLSMWAWAKGASRTAVLYLLTTSLAVFAIMLFPPVTMALQPRLGYLLMRFTWLLPLPAALAFAVRALLPMAARGPAASRLAGIAGLAGLALLFRHPIADAALVFADPSRAGGREDVAGMEPWREPLAWMDRHLPAGSVVLSDPATSYAIPMATRHWVATLVDQHSSPNDSLALVRILQSRDALDPNASWERTREILAERGVTAIALNDRFREVPTLDYWAPGHAWYRAARARFDAEPAAFRRAFDSGDFVVYEIDRAALAQLADGGAERPYVRPAVPGDPAPLPMGKGLPSLAGFHLDRAAASPGDTLVAVCTWAAPVPLPAGSYTVALRFDHAMPSDFRAPAWFAKPARKVYEARAGVRFRFRADHLPVNGEYGVDRWAPQGRIADSAAVVVPADVAPGEYEVQVRIIRQPHYPNYRLGDFFLDRDYYSGVRVGTLRVESRPEKAGS
jgi:hypothetical protein